MKIEHMLNLFNIIDYDREKKYKIIFYTINYKENKYN